VRFLKGGPMGHFLEPQQALKLLHVPKDGDDAAIVGSEELLQGQHREQLPLGEIVPGILGRIGGQRPASHPQGHPGQCLWRLRHASLGHHVPYNGHPRRIGLRVSTEQLDG